MTIKDLTVEIDGKRILDAFKLEVEKGSCTVVVGPNGHGKSTLLGTLMGLGIYEVQTGEMNFGALPIGSMSLLDRAKSGIFLSYQEPVELPELTVEEHFKSIAKAHSVHYEQVWDKLMNSLAVDCGLVWSKIKGKKMNVNFSGGEKKRLQLLEIMLCRPSLLLLDEIDTGLDIDNSLFMANAVNKYREKNPDTTILAVTHNMSFAKQLNPDGAIVIKDGKNIKQGKGTRLIARIEREGYKPL